MKIKIVTLISALAVVIAASNDMALASDQHTIVAAAQTHHGTGTIKQIDKKANTVELTHGPIKSIGWMSMTMVFDVEDADLLDEIDVGDRVEFDFIETRDKHYVITEIEYVDDA